MSKKVGIIKSPKYLLHCSREDKIEKPERLFEVYKYLENNTKGLTFYEPEIVSEEQLKQVHSSFYINQVKQYSEQGGEHNYDKDTYINQHTYNVARLAAGGCIKLADKILEGEIDKGFALVRPPGHHAEAGRAMGFCIFNNIAITASHLIDKYGLERILIVDFDAHHGNGTQEIFYDNPKVLTLSIHQNDIFPLTGKGKDVGINEEEGFNINIPVHPYFEDEEFSYIFGKIIQQVAETYLPQIILVAAGYDAHIDDNVSKLKITSEGYANITKFLSYFADKYSDGKLLYVLEGGYNIEALSSSLISTIETLKTQVLQPPGFMFSERANKIIQTEIPDMIKKKWCSENI